MGFGGSVCEGGHGVGHGELVEAFVFAFFDGRSDGGGDGDEADGTADGGVGLGLWVDVGEEFEIDVRHVGRWDHAELA